MRYSVDRFNICRLKYCEIVKFFSCPHAITFVNTEEFVVFDKVKITV